MKGDIVKIANREELLNRLCAETDERVRPRLIFLNVRQKAEELGIYLVYLLPYSPNLNPIKFIWKSIKRVLSTSFVPNLAEMKRIITESFDRFPECKSYVGYWIDRYILEHKNYKNLCV